MNLKNVKYLNNFRKLPYSKDKMLIIGSGTMALLGLRRNKDLDVWVTKDLFQKISKNSMFNKSVADASGDISYTTKDGKIEIFDKLSPLKDRIENQLKRSVFIYGIHFQSPEDVLSWKKTVNRPKDLRDIKLLEEYLRKEVVEYYLKTIQLLK